MMNDLKHNFNLGMFNIASEKFDMGKFKSINNMCMITYNLHMEYKSNEI